MKTSQLDALERRAAALLSGAQFVRVIFADGSSRRLPLPDCVPLLLESSSPAVVEIEDAEDTGGGQLLELLRGLLVEVEA